jgi:tripartite-type tricarboxylate transporter receptor subunit TctC
MANRRTFLMATGAALAAGIVPSRAQDYPNRPIRIVVPLAAGGMADILARTIAAKLTEAGHTTLVENRTGGAGVIGADAVAKSPADGYTLLMGLHATQAILVHLQKLPYDPAKDFAPVIHAATVPNVLLLHEGVPAASLPMPKPIPAS